MSIFKCKMCGGTLEVNNNETVGVCEYCGTKQTLPKLDDDRKTNLYDRANHFRRNNDYDKAMSIYENILNEDKTDAEAYWSLVLCRYGIEYVEDPVTHKRVPTVNRAQFTSVFMDEDYKSAIEYADPVQKSIYEDEAKAIDEIQKGILEISQKEKPFDVFICYKETDSNGRRTHDSVLANDIYHQLTQEGLKVFFSRITLEDKLGTAYEPYIFAALNSAKVMVVLGTKPEYFNAVWVKNEWSRFLALIRNGAKKALIPAYKDMDPYDLPEEFSHLQAQDMSKIGFMQDLIRGIKKLAGTGEKTTTAQKETVIVNTGNVNVEPLLKRAYIFLEDKDWNSADEYAEKVLDQDPESGYAYLVKLMVDLRVSKQEELKNCKYPFDDQKNYIKIMRFADKDLKATVKGYVNAINSRIKNEEIENAYQEALDMLAEIEKDTLCDKYSDNDAIETAEKFEALKDYKESKEKAKKCRKLAEEMYRVIAYSDAVALYNYAQNYDYNDAEEKYNEAIEEFEELGDYKDSKEYIKKCKEKLLALPKDRIYSEAEELLNRDTVIYSQRIEKLEKAVELFKSIPGWKNADEYAEQCLKGIEEQKQKKKITRIIQISTLSIIAVFLTVLIIINTVVIPKNKYNQALEYINNKDYGNALNLLDELGDYKDSKELVNEYKLSFSKLSNYSKYIACGDSTVGLKSDGTVVATGDNSSGQCDVSGWKDIVAVSAGEWHTTVGLKSDGTVVATGLNYSGQCDVSDWEDIVAVSAGEQHTVGLKSDGTVVAKGYNNYGQCDVSDWKDIVAVSAGEYHTVGLKSDGTVVTTGYNDIGQCDVSYWEDIVAVSAGSIHTVGLKSDGTVVATGSNYSGQCDVSDWEGIVAVSAGKRHTLGLISDGTVVATGDNDYGQCDVSGWKDIVAVSAGVYHTVGLKSDGTVVATGSNNKGQCDVSDWKLW